MDQRKEGEGKVGRKGGIGRRMNEEKDEGGEGWAYLCFYLCWYD